MLTVKGLSKSFGTKRAITNLSLTLEEGHIFGMLGTNGAGKSTLLRVMSGVLRADAGSVHLDNMSVYENPAAKREICYLSDDPTFLPNASIAEMGRMQAPYYPDYSESKLKALCERFALPMNERITSFSKGTQKRAQICLGLALNPRVLLCDETFDG
ncbi:MAG: ABC transporter ATP-binding protein, partial [Kiritimatiellae bacterium]|nr:ABC transporter ATP-binding protein [Kiritimatiellia bacterium]